MCFSGLFNENALHTAYKHYNAMFATFSPYLANVFTLIKRHGKYYEKIYDGLFFSEIQFGSVLPKIMFSRYVRAHGQ